MNTYKAIQHFKYVKPQSLQVLHARVVELDTENTAAAQMYNSQKSTGLRPGQLPKDRKCEARHFKCLDCGLTWVENINSPDIVTDKLIAEYYPQHIHCTELKD